MSATSQIILHISDILQRAYSEIISVLRFVRAPMPQQQDEGDPNWALRAIYLSVLTVILIAPFAFLINSLQEYLGIEESQPAANAITIASVVFIAPFLEEILFRAGLRNPLYSLVITPIIAMAFLISSGQQLLIFSIFFIIIAIITVLNWNIFFGSSYIKIEKLYAQKFRIIFWANCIYFACAHLNNFKLSGVQIALFWLVVTPQLAFAVIFSYLRLRNGVKSAILSHATINLIGFTALTFQA